MKKSSVAYDEELVERIRTCLAEQEGISVKMMFGGVVFLVHGNMAIGVNRSDLMIRIGKELYEKVLVMDGIREMDFTGKPLKGFVYVDETATSSDRDLEKWVMLAVDFSASLPKKEKKN